MTRFDKSDAQLDAEAEARRRHLTPPSPEHGFDDPDAYDPPAFTPSPPPKARGPNGHPAGDCSCLSCSLIRLRLVLKSEAPGRLNQRAAIHFGDGESDEGGNGMPLSAAMHRFLGHADHWGLTRLGMSSILEVSDWCAATHPPHRRELFTRTECGQLLYEAAYLGQSLDDLEWLHPELSPEQIHGMLLGALKVAEKWRDDRFRAFVLRWSADHSEPVKERRPFRVTAA